MKKKNASSRAVTEKSELEWIRPTQQKRSQDVLEAILDVAQSMSNARPFDEISVTEVCKAAGCSVPSFYRRFDDKEALLHALHTRHAHAAILTAKSALDLDRWENESLGKILGSVIELLARTNYQASGLRLTASMRAAHDDRFADRIRQVRKAVFDGLKNVLVERAHEHAHVDPDLAARFVIRLTYGVLTRHFEDSTVNERVHPLSDQQLVDELKRATLTYLGIRNDKANNLGG